jgi:DNA adenine methylase
VSGFTSYFSEGFSHNDTKRLKDVADALVDKGCIVLISNNATQYVLSLFDDDRYTIKNISANRSINSIGSNRRNAAEVLIYGRL